MDQTEPTVPPHVERFLAEARKTLSIVTSDTRGPVRIVLRWRMEDKSYGSLERTYTANPKRNAEVPS